MVIFAFKTNKGKVREKNEDAFGYFRDEFFVIADGLGGLPAGEMASKIAVEVAIKAYQKKNNIKQAFEIANKAVFEKTQKEPKFSGMATTLVGVAIKNDKAIFANVGDSRGYLMRDLRLTQITQDHEDFWGAITRVIGYFREVKVDIFNFSLKKDDLLLLCTDGLTDVVPDDQLLTILKKTGSSQKELNQKAQELINVALSVGGIDNITVCLIHQNPAPFKERGF